MIDVTTATPNSTIQKEKSVTAALEPLAS